MRKNLLPTLILSLLPLPLLGAQERPRVFVSIAPQAWLLEQLAGDAFEVEVLLPLGASPHRFHPSGDQLRRLATADAYLTIGAPFEKRLVPMLANAWKHLNLIDMRSRIEQRLHFEPVYPEDMSETQKAEAMASRKTEPGKEYFFIPVKGTDDPWSWTDPQQLKIQATHAYVALANLHPGLAPEFRRRLSSLKQRLEDLDNRIATLLASHQDREFMVQDPTLGHFADRYGIIQRNIHSDRGRPPPPGKLARLIEQGRQQRVRVILVPPQGPTQVVDLLARTFKARTISFDPFARDIEANLMALARRLAENFVLIRS